MIDVSRYRVRSYDESGRVFLTIENFDNSQNSIAISVTLPPRITLRIVWERKTKAKEMKMAKFLMVATCEIVQLLAIAFATIWFAVELASQLGLVN